LRFLSVYEKPNRFKLFCFNKANYYIPDLYFFGYVHTPEKDHLWQSLCAFYCRHTQSTYPNLADDFTENAKRQKGGIAALQEQIPIKRGLDVSKHGISQVHLFLS